MISRTKKVLIILLLMLVSYFAGYATANNSGTWEDVRESLLSFSDNFSNGNSVDVDDLSDLDKVYVTDVIDGDTIDIRFVDGSEDRVRMVGIDTPESYGENDPSKWEGIEDSILLDMWGKKAKDKTTETLMGTYIYLDYDEVAGERGYYGRLLAYVILDDGSNYNAMLVKQGYARVYISSDCELMEQLLEFETDARNDSLGVWVEATGATKTGMRIDIINPYDEYVIISNYTDSPVDLCGWELIDAADSTYTFPEGFILGVNGSVKIYTCTGIDTNTSLYWNHPTYVWNNSSDTAQLYDAQHNLIYTFTY